MVVAFPGILILTLSVPNFRRDLLSASFFFLTNYHFIYKVEICKVEILNVKQRRSS